VQINYVFNQGARFNAGVATELSLALFLNHVLFVFSRYKK
jgi:hypothetical protein